MRVIVPFAADDPKTRLSGRLEPGERAELARAMLEDVLDAIRLAGEDPEILATAAIDANAPVEIDDRPLTEAVNGILRDTDDPVAVVMADLGLATPESIERLLDSPGDVVLVPGRGGGTNALVVRHPAFRVDYHDGSYLDHLEGARGVGATVREIDSYRLSTDIDEPGDLVELYLHGEGRGSDWLLDAGFDLRVEGGRVSVTRS